jgi:hypothetical protein
MSAADFQEEQQYMDGKRRLLNRLIFRSGIVCGFSQIVIGNPVKQKGNEIEITFTDGGAAIDCCGNEILVPADSTKTFSKAGITGTPFYLYLKYKQLPAEPAAAVTDSSGCEKICNDNRIVEDFEVIASTEEPGPGKNKVFSCEEIHDAEDKEKFIKECLGKQCSAPDPGDPKVFLAAINGNLTIDPKETLKYRSYVYNNQLLGELLTCWISGFGPSQPGRDFYKAVEVKLDSADKSMEYPIYHGFSCLPVVDVLEKVPKSSTKVNKFTFFLKETQTEEIAKSLGKSKQDIEKSARSLEDFKKDYDPNSLVSERTRFNTYYNKIAEKYNVHITDRLRRDNPYYLQVIKRVYFIEQTVEEEYFWKKISLDVEIRVNEQQVVITNPNKKKGTIKVVMVA